VIDQTKTNVSVARRSWTRYTVDLAAGYASFDVTLSGGSGDADLYIRHGAASTTSSFDCKSESSSNNESCSQASPAAGTWYIDVYGYRASSGMTLTVKANP
ncbi:PPC domain-containing protein, partial [Pseudoalteromonas tunicata]